MPNLLIITGQEGTGKSTLCRILLKHTVNAASFGAEDVGQTNPWEMNAEFMELLWSNVICLIRNFLKAGFSTVIAASFIHTYENFRAFKRRFPDDMDIYIVHLCADRAVRDARRISRSKPTHEAWREEMEKSHPEDMTLKDHLADYRYIRIDNTDLSAEETVIEIMRSIPELYQVDGKIIGS
ncbi:MAG: hypothetical protein JWM56_436 [Candidatus Peribacteria bacterium]|nr:hypothetical protein [Candidatus Peribacteria bacterium]